MDIALVSGNPHLPQLIGGVEISTHELAHALIAASHKVIVVARLSPRGVFGARRMARSFATGRRVHVDSELGYPVYRSIKPWDEVSRLPRVDVGVIQNGRMLEFGNGFKARGVPTAAYFHGLAFEEWDRRYVRNPALLPFDGYVVVSKYSASRFKRSYGLESTVVPPSFRKDRYLTRVRGSEVTFINPVPVKGLELALQVARLCPDIPFGFVLGWPQGIVDLARLRQAIRRLPNVRLRNRTDDMRTIYCDTKLLLVPSQWEAETWGRVVSEAQFSGIPVIASNRGALPEAVGPGGVILAFNEPPEAWVAAIRRLWYDEVHYKHLSDEALRHSSRSLVDPVAQAHSLVEALSHMTRDACARVGP